MNWKEFFGDIKSKLEPPAEVHISAGETNLNATFEWQGKPLGLFMKWHYYLKIKNAALKLFIKMRAEDLDRAERTKWLNGA
jgi:hypothetical protein